ncbi:protease Do [Maricaulis sp. W15]|uniref:Probable periplasmic serine endoprotease DegP-like n=1 Tax=Maricaulis maris TaxID=74318 RepID=A0A495D1A2_9PROT|nr:MULTISPECIES: Do family serine endopeptidase [Maricaulis]OLF72266.1 protease Do [Maricaulis sp. W15]RKQ95266.1 serine protease Do [Maricaulis maris]
MISVDRMRRLGGVSLLALSALAAGSLLDRSMGEAHAFQSAGQPPLAAAVPAGAPMSFADLIESVSPSVVTVQVSGTVDMAQFGGGDGPDMDNLPPQMREWLERQFGGQRPQPQPRQSLGSGFFISADGYLVTNNHVVANADEITIGMSDGEEFPARVIGTDPQTDLALLKVDSDVDFPFVRLEEDPQYRVGDWVVAVGNPFGLGGTATAGIISAIGRPIGNSTYNDFIQVDAPINRGNSGGPTFDLNGNVIGVNSQIFSPTGGNVGIGFAIPSDVAARIIADLRDDGRVARGWLGVSIQNVTDDIAEALGLEGTTGAIVSSIVEGGPADQAGFEREDVVLEVDGETVDGSRDLTRRIGNIQAGEEVRFLVLRDGREHTVRARLGDRPGEQELASMSSVDQVAPRTAVFGMSMAPLAEEDREVRGLAPNVTGVVVDEVEPGSEAARKGVLTGDIILEAGGEPVDSADALRVIADEAREDGRSAILLLVQGRGGQRYVALQLGDAD